MSTPPILYKYIRTEHALTVLQNLKLKLTPPIEFDDPFEFLMRVEGSMNRRRVGKMMDRNSHIRLVYELALAKGLCSGDFKTFRRDFKANREKHLRDAIRFAEPVLGNHLKGQFLVNLSKMYAVLCLSEVRDSILMWSHYASGHRGIVLGIEIPPSWKIHQVEYGNQRVAIDLAWNPNDERCQDMLRALVKAKGEDWKYEREWRALGQLDRLEQIQREGKVQYFAKMQPKFVKEILLGWRFPEGDMAEIITLHKQWLPQARLLKASLHDSEYRMIISDLQSSDPPPATR